jgi:hypothetical protein
MQAAASPLPKWPFSKKVPSEINATCTNCSDFGGRAIKRRPGPRPGQLKTAPMMLDSADLRKTRPRLEAGTGAAIAWRLLDRQSAARQCSVPASVRRQRWREKRKGERGERSRAGRLRFISVRRPCAATCGVTSGGGRFRRPSPCTSHGLADRSTKRALHRVSWCDRCVHAAR